MNNTSWGQKNSLDSIENHKKRTYLIANAVTGGIYLGSMTALYQTWYRDYTFERFHFFNDIPEWKGMDKLGHATTAWWASQWLYSNQESFELHPDRLLARSTLIPLLFMTTIEVFDGFSSGWGFSLGDIAANTAGAGLFYSQQRIFNEQVLLLKYSYHPTDFASKRPELLGNSSGERMLKDYNGQTYWLSMPLKRSGWFCMSIGYNANGMLGGRDNRWLSQGNFIDYSSVERISTWSLSFDIDLLKLPIRGKLWKTFASTFRFLKIPAPAIQWNRTSNFSFQPMYY